MLCRLLWKPRSMLSKTESPRFKSISSLSAAVSESPSASAPLPHEVVASQSQTHAPEPRGIQIERYDGNVDTCRSFLVNCFLLFELNASISLMRVATPITHLTGKAREWATAE